MLSTMLAMPEVIGSESPARTVLFISPGFPPNAYRYCTALAARGARVLAIGDVPTAELSPELAASLTEYVFEPQMGTYEVLRAAVAGLVARHGVIDRLDSNGEHWLALEARLRDDFNVKGLGTAQLESVRSKRAMAQIFQAAGIESPPGVLSEDVPAVRELVRIHGLPVVFKPDTGSGAVDTFSVTTPEELESVLQRSLIGYLVQPFIAGTIVTYDGLVTEDGRIVFTTSHVYDAGIMQVRVGRLDGYYYSLRTIPSGLDLVGRRAVEAFNILGRFFHLEFFDTPDGYVALEINVRPPGGFTPDMMNAACEIDVYDLWAAIVTGAPVAETAAEHPFHSAHAGRRDDRAYRTSDEDLVAELGSTLTRRVRVPDAFAATMGNTAYLLRHRDLDALLAAIALVQTPVNARTQD
jgi:hypothetical protein